VLEGFDGIARTPSQKGAVIWQVSDMHRTGVFLVVLFVLFAPGCSSDPEHHASVPPPQALPTIVANASRCSPAELEGLPHKAGCLTGLDGDADGDGSPDTFLVFAVMGADRLPRKWFFGLRTSNGLEIGRLHAGNAFTYPRVVGVADVDRDGRDELFIKAFDLAGHGTNWQQLNLLVARDGRLQVVTYEKEPLALRVGGPSRTGEGVGCSDGDLELLRAESQSRQNTDWDYSIRRFEIVGTKARLKDRRTGELELADYNDPSLDPFYRLECSGLRYPDF
jgi:hypothetical protein